MNRLFIKLKDIQVDAFKKSEEINMSCRSDNLKTGVARAPHRSLLKASVLLMKKWADQSLVLPNSFNEIIPGHVGLKNM